MTAGRSTGTGRGKEVAMSKCWVGIDAGKEFHWAVVVDEAGQTVLSRRVDNDESAIAALVDDVDAIDGETLWAVDMPGGVASLALSILWQRGCRVTFVPGITVDRARDGVRGEAKTDARDARLIADTARWRTDLSELAPSEEELAALTVLTSHRRDLVQDRTRAITRLRDALASIFPGLERTLDFKTAGAVTLVSRYQTPAEIRRAGKRRIEEFLRAQGVRKSKDLAERALAAAKAQRVVVPAENVTADIVSSLARQLMTLRESLATVDEEIERRFFCHPQAEILVSLPGMGPRLGAEFLVAVGWKLEGFASGDHLAAYAGLVPVARDSGKRTGNLRRMRGGNKVLKRVFYQAAFASLRHPDSRAFYDRKRKEGKRHNQALIALARRRVNVLWAMLRDEQLFKPRAA